MKRNRNLKSKTKVFVAMSGGVDSSVCALLLKKQGYDCTGVFMKNWSGENWGIDNRCPWKKDQEDAKSVCKILDIPFLSYNFEKEYRNAVIAHFFDELKKGRTPNPDVLCNKEIKFGLFLDRALDEGADYIATGHYARVERDGLYKLLKGVDEKKDQSYFLHLITQKQLSKTLFPIGSFRKKEIRSIAQDNKLPNADKPDSQGICFVGEINIKDFIKSNLGEKTGNIVTVDGRKIGMHNGVWFYTIGQREGIGIGGGEPYFVVDKDIKNNRLVVAKGRGHEYLYSDSLILKIIHWISEKKEILPLKCEASIRYQQKPQAASVIKIKNGYKVKFEEKQRAVTIGQSCVLYKDEECLGGGVIEG